MYVSTTHYFPFRCDYLMDSRLVNAQGDYLMQQLQHEKYFFKNVSHNNKTIFNKSQALQSSDDNQRKNAPRSVTNNNK